MKEDLILRVLDRLLGLTIAEIVFAIDRLPVLHPLKLSSKKKVQELVDMRQEVLAELKTFLPQRPSQEAQGGEIMN